MIGDWVEPTFEGVATIIERRFPGERIGNFQDPDTGQLKYAIHAVHHTGVRHPHIPPEFIDPLGLSWR